MKKSGKGGAGDERFADVADALGGVKPIEGGKRVARNPQAAAPKRPGAAAPRFERPDPDEPLLGRRSDTGPDVLARLARGEPAPTSSIDLHRLDRAGAERALTNAIETAARTGVAVLRVVHGRGERSPDGIGVLRGAVAGWLVAPKLARHVRAFAPDRPGAGPRGATHVLLDTARANAAVIRRPRA